MQFGDRVIQLQCCLVTIRCWSSLFADKLRVVSLQLSETEARRDALHATLVKTQGEVQHLTMALQQASQVLTLASQTS